MRSEGTYKSDNRRLFAIRETESEILTGQWESDPVFESRNFYCETCSPHRVYKKGVMRGTFRATFYSSSGDSWYIKFKEGPESGVQPGREDELSFTKLR